MDHGCVVDFETVTMVVRGARVLQIDILYGFKWTKWIGCPIARDACATYRTRSVIVTPQSTGDQLQRGAPLDVLGGI